MMISQGAGGKLETGISCNLPASLHPFLSFVLHFGIVYFYCRKRQTFGRLEQRRVRKAHNLEVVGSSPTPATTGEKPGTGTVQLNKQTHSEHPYTEALQQEGFCVT